MTAPVQSQTGTEEWRKGWTVTLSAGLGMAVSLLHLYSLGVFIEPLEREFGWQRGDISAGPAIVSVVFVIASIFVGMLLDRVSARTVAVPGLILYCLGLAVLGLSGPSIWSWWGGWVLLAIGASCTSATVWTLSVARRFNHQRGLALAFVLAGTGLCSTFAPGLANMLIEHFGWRGAYVGLGIVGALIALPTTLLFLNDGHTGGLRRKTGAPAAPQHPGLSVREGLLSWRFWRLGTASLLVVVGTLAIVVHFVPILTERGLDRGSAVVVAGLVGLSSVVGRIVTGFLLDRFHGKNVGFVTFAAPVLVCFLLLQHDGSAFSASVAAIGLGLALGAEIDVVAYLTTRYFGLRHYGVMFGVINVLLKIGSGLGPLIGGVVYDHFKSYVPLITALIATFVVSALLMLSLGKYPTFADKPSEHP